MKRGANTSVVMAITKVDCLEAAIMPSLCHKNLIPHGLCPARGRKGENTLHVRKVRALPAEKVTLRVAA